MPLNIFLVEDNPTIQQSLVPALAELIQATVVHIAESEIEAQAWLATNSNWHLAVVDLFLKQGNGFGVLELLKGRTESQRVAVLTNYPTTGMKERSLTQGADAVFDKSTELDAFFEFCSQQETHVARQRD